MKPFEYLYDAISGTTNIRLKPQKSRHAEHHRHNRKVNKNEFLIKQRIKIHLSDG